jgi:hypothetical protein
MAKTTIDLKGILRIGGGLIIDASTKTTIDLKELARIANSSGATIIMRNAGTKTTSDLKEIARLAPGKVIFED